MCYLNIIHCILVTKQSCKYKTIVFSVDVIRILDFLNLTILELLRKTILLYNLT